MTPQEALLEIRNKAFRNTDDYEIKISKNCYKEIITALEKQIPKIPRKVVRTSCNSKTISEITEFNFYNPAVKKEVPEYAENKYDDYLCPVCNALTKDGTPKYCWRCGQALDWEVLKNES